MREQTTKERIDATSARNKALGVRLNSKGRPLKPIPKVPKAEIAAARAECEAIVKQKQKRVPMTDAQILEVIELQAQGHTIVTACEQLKLPYAGVVARLLRNPEFAHKTREAHEKYLQLKIYALNDIAAVYPDVNRARLMCDNIKWEASRVLRKTYGDHVTVAGDAENPLVTHLAVSAQELLAEIGKTYDHDPKG